MHVLLKTNSNIVYKILLQTQILGCFRMVWLGANVQIVLPWNVTQQNLNETNKSLPIRNGMLLTPNLPTTLIGSYYSAVLSAKKQFYCRPVLCEIRSIVRRRQNGQTHPEQ